MNRFWFFIGGLAFCISITNCKSTGGSSAFAVKGKKLETVLMCHLSYSGSFKKVNLFAHSTDTVQVDAISEEFELNQVPHPVVDHLYQVTLKSNNQIGFYSCGEKQKDQNPGHPTVINETPDNENCGIPFNAKLVLGVEIALLGLEPTDKNEPTPLVIIKTPINVKCPEFFGQEKCEGIGFVSIANADLMRVNINCHQTDLPPAPPPRPGVL